MGFCGLYTATVAGPPSPAFSQLTVRYTGSSLPFGAVTTHGVTTPVGALDDVILQIHDAAQSLGSCLTPDVTVDDVLWKVGPEATGPSILIDVGQVGVRSGSAAPPNVANLVRLPVVGLSGRYGGRFYLPGVAEEDVNPNGTLEPDYAAAVLGGVESFYELLEEVEALPRVFSSNGGDPREVASVQVALRVASQRRRNRR